MKNEIKKFFKGDIEDYLETLKKYSHENGMFFVDGMDMYIQQMIKQWSLFLNNIEGVERKISEDDIVKAWGIKL